METIQALKRHQSSDHEQHYGSDPNSSGGHAMREIEDRTAPRASCCGDQHDEVLFPHEPGVDHAERDTGKESAGERRAGVTGPWPFHHREPRPQLSEQLMLL